jgi:hypothetical protein
LINPQANIKDTLKHFNDLRERWKTAGPIPKINTTMFGTIFIFMWKTSTIICILDREARDLDFKHNLEQNKKS